jgi:hypothetical protein
MDLREVTEIVSKKRKLQQREDGGLLMGQDWPSYRHRATTPLALQGSRAEDFPIATSRPQRQYRNSVPDVSHSSWSEFQLELINEIEDYSPADWLARQDETALSPTISLTNYESSEFQPISYHHLNPYNAALDSPGSLSPMTAQYRGPSRPPRQHDSSGYTHVSFPDQNPGSSTAHEGQRFAGQDPPETINLKIPGNGVMAGNPQQLAAMGFQMMRNNVISSRQNRKVEQIAQMSMVQQQQQTQRMPHTQMQQQLQMQEMILQEQLEPVEVMQSQIKIQRNKVLLMSRQHEERKRRHSAQKPEQERYIHSGLPPRTYTPPMDGNLSTSSPDPMEQMKRATSLMGMDSPSGGDTQQQQQQERQENWTSSRSLVDSATKATSAAPQYFTRDEFSDLDIVSKSWARSSAKTKKTLPFCDSVGISFHYTISEDRSGSQEAIMRQRLAALTGTCVIGDGLAGHFADKKAGNHGFLGTIGGAILGPMTEDYAKKQQKKHHHHSSQSFRGDSVIGYTLKNHPR